MLTPHISLIRCKMFARKFVIINLIVHVIIVFSYVDVAHAVRCSRIPEGSGAKRSPSTGNFRIRFSDDSGVYKPGKQYTSKIFKFRFFF